MAKTNHKFGVVYGTPSQLSADKIQEGKLYFLAGDESNGIKQGIYGVNPLTSDVPNGVFDLALFGTGAIANGSGYGLSQENFTTDASTMLKELNDASNSYLLESNYVQVTASADGYVPMYDASDGSIDSSTKDWVLTYDSSSKKLGWYTLPKEAFLNDKGVTSVTISQGEGITCSSSGSAITTTGTRIISLNKATNSSLGGIKLGYKDNGKNYKVNVDSSGNAYVNVPWLDKAEDASHADSADKVSNTFDISLNGSDIITYNGSANKTLGIKAGTNITINNSSGTLTFDTSGVPTTTEMNTAINNALTSALKYKGIVDGSSKKLPATHSAGDVYVASASFTTTTTETDVEYSVESGDYFISNGTIFNVVNGENQVSNANATLAWNYSTKIATVDGTDIYVKLPSNPNSDTWRSVYVDSTSVLGGGTNTSALKFVDGNNIDAYWDSTNKTIQFNHKAPTANDSSKIALSASSTKSATWGSTDLVTGITVKRDVYGHVTDVSISSIQMPSNPNTDTHYTSKNVVCSTSTGTSNGAASDGAVRINHIEESTVTSSHLIDGSGTVTVTSDSNGKITITGTDTNTDTKVKDTSVTTKSFLLGHASQGSTAEAQTNASCYMSGGYLYSGGSKVLTSYTDTKNTAGATASSSKLFIIGAGSQGDNPQTYSNANVYIDGSCLYSNGKKVATSEEVTNAQAAATIYWETL